MSHYFKGWHSTATIGTFGSTVAASKLIGLNSNACAEAIGIAATQAAGLKSMFGTMCKPLHAGKAAQNGLLAAQLVARGFGSRADILECNQGFAHTQSESTNLESALQNQGEYFEVNDVLFKYLASCYMTHSTIEAIQNIIKNSKINHAAIISIKINVASGCLDVCGIEMPKSGLEAKFSLKFCAAAACMGWDTSQLLTFSDECVSDSILVDLINKTQVVEKSSLSRMEVEVSLVTQEKVVHFERYDAGIPSTELAIQWDKLVNKFQGCVSPILGESKTKKIISIVNRFDEIEDISEMIALTQP